MKEPYQIREFKKGDVYVDPFVGQSKTEVIEIEPDNIVVLKNTWFDPCKMDWASESIKVKVERRKSPREDTYFIITHGKVLVENKDEETVLLAETNEMIKNYKEKYESHEYCRRITK